MVRRPGNPGSDSDSSPVARSGRATYRVARKARRSTHWPTIGSHLVTGLPATLTSATAASVPHTGAVTATPSAPAPYSATTSTTRATASTVS